MEQPAGTGHRPAVELGRRPGATLDSHGNPMRPVPTTRMPLTADQVLDLPVPDHLRGYELENGELVEVTPVSPPHGRIAAKLAHELLKHLEEARLGGEVYVEAGCVLEVPDDPERLRGPDLCYLGSDTLQQGGGEPDRGWFRLAPDLVIEIDSPERRPAVEQRRIQDYLDAGVEVLWVVHTLARSATIYRPDGSARLIRAGEALRAESVLPGLEVPLAKLFGEGATYPENT